MARQLWPIAIVLIGLEIGLAAAYPWFLARRRHRHHRPPGGQRDDHQHGSPGWATQRGRGARNGRRWRSDVHPALRCRSERVSLPALISGRRRPGALGAVRCSPQSPGPLLSAAGRQRHRRRCRAEWAGRLSLGTMRRAHLWPRQGIPLGSGAPWRIAGIAGPEQPDRGPVDPGRGRQRRAMRSGLGRATTARIRGRRRRGHRRRLRCRCTTTSRAAARSEATRTGFLLCQLIQWRREHHMRGLWGQPEQHRSVPERRAATAAP